MDGMNTRMQRLIRGPLERRELSPGTWLWSAPGGGELLIRGAEPGAAEVLRRAAPRAVSVDWLKDGALVTLITDAGPRLLRARVAVAHEPLGHLYEALPLASFEPDARRFWRRVFFLVRIPGGRRLLGLVARRAGGSAVR
jgi:hypothetical protein